MIDNLLPGTLSENKKLKFLSLESNKFSELPFKESTRNNCELNAQVEF